jgi:SOS-response transcriptional repressor LexA
MEEGFWGNVRKELSRLDKTQVWLMEKSGVKRTTINNGINRSTPEKPSNPHVDDAVRIAQVLETTVEYLVTGNPPADMPEDILSIIRVAKKLNIEGKKAALGAIQGLQVLYPQEEGEAMYPFETRDAEPAYPQSPDIAEPIPEYSADTPEFENDVEYLDWEMIMIPYFGKTAAGEPLDISIPPDEYMPFLRQTLKGNPEDYFYLKIQGYSMVDAGINEGDMVVIRRAEEPINGEIMLVRHENASTLKKISIKRGKIYLCWEDGTGKRIPVDSGDYEVQGVLVWITKRPQK